MMGLAAEVDPHRTAELAQTDEVGRARIAAEREGEREGERPLTREQAAIIGAFTGICCGPFSDIHNYAERKLGRPMWTHEFAAESVARELKEAAREDFARLCYSASAHDHRSTEAALREEVEKLREALEPFVREFEERRKAYIRRYPRNPGVGAHNFDAMPDEWEMEKATFKMGDFRCARTALASREGGDQ